MGNFEMLRVPMGCKVSAAHYQRCMVTVLVELLYKTILQYLDDELMYTKGERALLDSLLKYFGIMDKHNIKLHPAKFVLFAKIIEWGGKLLSEDGVRPTDQRTMAVRDMPEPTYLNEMMHLVYGVAWFRSHLPFFAEIAAPLYDLWKDTLAPFKKKTIANAKKFELAKLDGWNNGGREAYAKIKEALIDAITLAFFDPNLQTCVFTDANKEFWCIAVTQCKPGVELLGWEEQVGKHKPLGIASGRFRHAQLRWHIVEKEGFLYSAPLELFVHWVNGGNLPTKFFADHKNLLALFSDKVRPMTCIQPSRDKMTRWGLNLRNMNYTIHHIDGEYNYLADLGSRWGNRYAAMKHQQENKDKEPFKRSLRLGPVRILQAVLPTDALEDTVRPKRVLRIGLPKVSDDIKKPDLDVKKLILPSAKTLVDRTVLYESQLAHAKTQPAGLITDGGHPPLLRNKQEQIWVPAEEEGLQRCLYALAHQGMSGHRGADATMALLCQHVTWETMERDVTKWRNCCLQCLKNAQGKLVPRPLGESLVAERPGEILCMDYIKLGPSRNGFCNVLLQLDKFSRFVRFTKCVVGTAVISARATLRWSAQFGLPSWIISDGGSHFKNTLMKELADLLGVEHHITLAYCPWANGSVEVTGRELVWTCKTTLSELRYSADEWDCILELLEFTLNHRGRAVLGGKSPIEVMTGRKPDQALKLATWSGIMMKNCNEAVIKADLVDQYCNKLADSL